MTKKKCYVNYVKNKLQIFVMNALFIYVILVLNICIKKKQILSIKKKIIKGWLTASILPVCHHTFADVEDFGKFRLRYTVVHVKTAGVTRLSIAVVPLCAEHKTHVATQVQVVVSQQFTEFPYAIMVNISRECHAMLTLHHD